MQYKNVSLLSAAVSMGIFSFFTSPILAQDIERVNVFGKTLNNTVSIELNADETAQPDFRDVLNRLPGVDINGNGPVTSIIQYRGLFGSRLRVNIDGAPVAGAGPNSMDPPLAHVFALPGTQVNVFRGVAPVSLGAETLGGAVQVLRNSSEAFNERAQWQGNVVAQGRELGDATQIFASSGYHSQQAYAQGFITDQRRDDTEDGNGNTLPNSFYERQAYGVSAGWQHANHQLHGHYQVVDTGESGTAALAMDIIYIDSSAYRLQYEWQPNNASSLTLLAFGNSNQHGMNNISFRPATVPMRARLNTVDSLSRGYTATWLQDMNSGKLSVGLEWLTNSHNSVITNPQLGNLTINNFNNVERTQSSVYAQWQTQWQEIEATMGARLTEVKASADEVSHSMAMMNPMVANLVNNFNAQARDPDFSFADLTLHLSHDITRSLSWQLALGQKNRAPSYTELFVWLPLGISAGLADGRNYIGNLALNHETANQIDLGLTYRRANLTLAPRLFYQRIDDYIVGDPSTNQAANMVSTMMTGRPPLQWSNVDATFYGADMLLSANLSKTLTLDMTASIVRAERDDIKQALFRIAPASLITRIMWQSNQLSFNLESEIVANQSRVSLIQDEQQSAGYGIINGEAKYQISPEIMLSARVTNLLDKAYQPHLSGINRIAGIEQPVGERLFAEGRNIGLSLNIVF